MKQKKTKRLSIDITPQQQADLRKLLEYGWRQAIFSVLIEDLITILRDASHETRELFLSGITSRKFKFLDVYVDMQRKKYESGTVEEELLSDD